MRETLHDSPSVLSSFQASPYYLSTAETEPEDDTLGFWGIQYKNCLKDRKDERYANMLRSGTLRHHLETVDKQANEMFRTIVEQEIEQQSITDEWKLTNILEWIKVMNTIRVHAAETVYKKLILSLKSTSLYTFPGAED